MRLPVLLVSIAALSAPVSMAQSLVGRWDLTITAPDATFPSWLEVTTKPGSTEVRIGGRVASVHPAREVKLDKSHLTFVTNESFGKKVVVTWDITEKGGQLSGVQKRDDGIVAKLTGERAPLLGRKMPTSWNAPEKLFNGHDLTGWEPLVTEQGKSPINQWKVVDGELVNQAPGANIRTKKTFQDFKLHVEFNCPQDGNSGIYLRGRYEVQVEYEPVDANDPLHGMGSIYGFLAPSKTVPKTPGQWETFDITLVGRRVTIVRNGVTTIDNQEIPGITGGALDSHEGQPGPLYIQGDHTGGMKYRNITISAAKPVPGN
jgi:hypothetical protein